MFPNTKILRLTKLKVIRSQGLEIIYNIKGGFIVYHRGKRKEISENTFLILNHLETIFILPLEEENILYTIRYSKDFLLNNGFKASLYLEENLFYGDEKFKDKFVNLLSCINEECFSRYNQLILNMINKLAIEDNFRFEKIKYIEEMLNIMEESSSSGLATISSLSISMGIPSNSLTRYFKDITGLNFSDYRQISLLEQSSDLLLSGDYNIDEITYIIGYRHSKSIYDIYNKYLLMTPLEYKNRYILYKSLPSKHLLRDEEYLSFIEKNSTISYATLYKDYIRDTDVLSLEENKRLKFSNLSGMNIYSIKNFGHNYIDKILGVDRDIGIDFIMISIGISEDSNFVYLNDLNINIHYLDLVMLINVCLDREIKIGLDVDIHGRKMDDYVSDEYLTYIEEDILIFKKFYQSILKVYGIQLMKNIENIISLRHIKARDIDATYISRLKKYYTCRLQVFDELLNYRLVNHSLHLGSGYIKDIRKIVEWYDLEKINIRQPKKVYYNIINIHDFKKVSKFNYDEMYQVYVKGLESLIEVKKSFNLKNIELVICEIYSELDIENITNDYYYLFVCYIILDSLLKLEDFTNINFSFSNGKDEDLPCIRTDLFSYKGLRTEFYHLYQMLSKLDGEIIYGDKGSIVSKNEYGYNVLLYGHLMVDYKYGLLQDFIFTEGDYRILDIELPNVEGVYKISKNILSLNHGSPDYILKDFMGVETLDYEDYQYVKSLNRPRRESKIIRVSKGFKDSIKLEPFNIIQISYKKITDL